MFGMTEALLQWAAQCSPASLSPAARVCAYCGRPPKATARRGDGCEGCGAPLGRGDV